MEVDRPRHGIHPRKLIGSLRLVRYAPNNHEGRLLDRLPHDEARHPRNGVDDKVNPSSTWYTKQVGMERLPCHWIDARIADRDVLRSHSTKARQRICDNHGNVRLCAHADSLSNRACHLAGIVWEENGVLTG